MPHIHRMRPVWVLVTGIADAEGYHPIVTHARCLECGHEAVLAAWQSPRAVQTRLEGEDTP